MRKKLIITMMLALITLTGCTSQTSVPFDVYLEGQLVNTDANKGLWSKWMFGDRIYALDHDLNVYSGKLTKSEWQKAEKILVQGHGENEFGDMVLSQGSDGTLYVVDHPFEGMMGESSLVSLTKILHPDELGTTKAPARWEKYDLTKLSDFNQIGEFVVISDSTFLTTGAPVKDMHHVLAVVNYKKQTVTPLDYWPNDSTPEVLTDQKLMTYIDGSGVACNGKDRYLYWDDSGKLAFIFTIDGEKVNILHQIYSDQLPIPGIAKTPSTERIHCVANNDKIYLLYKHSNRKGETMEKYDLKEPFPWGNSVEVYDWDGVKQQVIHLDKFGQEIMLSDDGKTLYLYSGFIDDQTAPYIYSYDLDSPSTVVSSTQTLEQKNDESLHVLEVGEEAVDAELYDMQGNKHRLFDAFADGRYVLLDFWNLHCGNCLKAEPELQEVYKRMQGKLEIVSINLDSIPDWKNSDWSKSIVWKNWSDGKGFKKGGIQSHYYDFKAVPFYVLLSPGGRILCELTGYGAGFFLGMAEALNGPKQDNYDNLNLAIREVDANNKGTTISFRYYTKKGYWFRITSDSYLTADGKKYKLTTTDGIKLNEDNYPQVKAYTAQSKYGDDIYYSDFTLTFEPFDTKPATFDFREGDGEDVFVIRSISL